MSRSARGVAGGADPCCVRRVRTIWPSAVLRWGASLLVLVAVPMIASGGGRAATEVGSLRLGAYAGDTGALAWLAHEHGLFAAHGLDVEMVPFEAGKLAVDALLAGDVDVATAAEFVVVSNSFEHPELRILATVAIANNNELVARRDRVREPQDLVGRRIGVTRKSAGEFLLGVFLTLNGLNVSDVELVDLPPSAIVTDLLAGTIDAGFTWDPNVYRMRQELADNAVGWPGQRWQQYYFVLVTTDRWLAEHPAAARALLEAVLASEQRAGEDPEDSKARLARRFGYDAAYVDYSWPRHDFLVELPQALLLAMEEQARWRIENGLSPAGSIPNYLSTLATAPLAELRPQTVTVIR